MWQTTSSLSVIIITVTCTVLSHLYIGNSIELINLKYGLILVCGAQVIEQDNEPVSFHKVMTSDGLF